MHPGAVNIVHRICAVSERWLELCSCGIVLCLISHEVQFVADVMIEFGPGEKVKGSGQRSERRFRLG